MPPAQDETNGRFKQTHGIYAFADRGEESLTPERHVYLKELKAKLATEEGRHETRIELAAAFALITQLGLSQLQEDVKAGRNIWDSGVIKILAAYGNSLQRMLDNWPPDKEKPMNIVDALRGDNE